MSDPAADLPAPTGGEDERRPSRIRNLIIHDYTTPKSAKNSRYRPGPCHIYGRCPDLNRCEPRQRCSFDMSERNVDLEARDG